jgi:hypothetical protein
MEWRKATTEDRQRLWSISRKKKTPDGIVLHLASTDGKDTDKRTSVLLDRLRYVWVMDAAQQKVYVDGNQAFRHKSEDGHAWIEVPEDE